MLIDDSDVITSRAANGSEVALTAHGGHVLSWVPATAGTELLWVSPMATAGQGVPVRGGVPVIFPRFAALPLTDPQGRRVEAPRHGFARTAPWVVSGIGSGDAAMISATMHDDAGTRAVWPYRFTLSMTARAVEDTLDLTLEVTNPGVKPMAFSAALHTYLRVSDAGNARVYGLGRDARPALGPVDELHVGLARTTALTLVDPKIGSIEVSAQAFSDVVFWNPGDNHGLPDIPVGGARYFVCLEAAQVNPVVLQPDETWTGTQTLRHLPRR